MSLKIQQDYRYKGNHYWKWTAWIEGADEDLDQIDHVVYMLDPTFLNPVRSIKDRASKFRLKSAGWGNFRLGARVFFKDGKNTLLTHDIVLKYPDGTPTTA
jgi:transcription initiation factor IIF auxiliary subunit